MTVRFFRLEIEGTNLSKLETIKSWLETKIDNNDISDKIVPEGVTIYDVEDSLTDKVLRVDLYLKSSVALNKYKDIIVTRFTGLNKSGLTSARVIQYDNCSHDEQSTNPCEPTIRMEWNE